MKVQTVGSISDFMSGDYQLDGIKTAGKIIAATAPALVVVVPKAALAATGIDSTFGNIHESVMNVFDAGVVLVIIFSGAAWGLGHRTKALEILIGVCCGYILARHAVDIRDFLKSI